MGLTKSLVKRETSRGGLYASLREAEILTQMLDETEELLSCLSVIVRNGNIAVPSFLSNELIESEIPNDAPYQIIAFVRKARKYLATMQGDDDASRSEKRRKLDNGEPSEAHLRYCLPYFRPKRDRIELSLVDLVPILGYLKDNSTIR